MPPAEPDTLTAAEQQVLELLEALSWILAAAATDCTFEAKVSLRGLRESVRLRDDIDVSLKEKVLPALDRACEAADQENGTNIRRISIPLSGLSVELWKRLAPHISHHY